MWPHSHSSTAPAREAAGVEQNRQVFRPAMRTEISPVKRIPLLAHSYVSVYIALYISANILTIY